MTEPCSCVKHKGPGPGLGLATCRAIIAEHHGHIEASSEPGKGTKMMVTIPRKR